ncbi:unnamed protein product [Adineta steineri]|uniref:Uncharacterized protein n=2 Tax=Adineta steineri TaxID=433720 RepID=A0A818ZSS1_9BILA|nr:unnamed protein product [Adineta steineri]
MSLDNNQYSYEQQNIMNGNNMYGQTGYSQSSPYGNKEEENMYRYASSRLTGRSSHPTEKSASLQTGTVQSPYTVESANVGTNNNHTQVPYQQQQTSFHAPSIHSQSSVSYQSNQHQQNSTLQPNHDFRQQQQQQYLSHPPNMANTDIFMPSSDTADPASYYNQYDTNNQSYQNSPQEQYPTYDQQPPLFQQQNTNPFINQHTISNQQTTTNNGEQYFTDPNHNQGRTVLSNTQQQDQDNKRNGKLPDQQASQKLPYRPVTLSKPNYVEKNIGMIKNKENYYHRYPARKYEETYAKRKDLQGGNGYDHDNSQIQLSSNNSHQLTIPLTFHLNSGENTQNESIPATGNIPYDNHNGDNVSVDINLRVVDRQNSQQQQQHGSDHPNWSGSDALERHIRKMERSLDQYLPTTHLPQRNPILITTSPNLPTGRYGAARTGMLYNGYNPPNYAKDIYNYSDKGQEEDSYLAKMHSKRHTDFKPYSTRDYDRFKKNYGFGTGHLGFDSENTTFKEKAEKMAKIKEYSQQIEARNKKMTSQASYRTTSETRSSTEELKSSRFFESPQLSKRSVRSLNKSTHSSPVSMTELVPLASSRRSTDVSSRPSPAHRATEVVHHLPSPRRPIETMPHSPPSRRATEIVSQSPRPRRRTDTISYSPRSRRGTETVSNSSSTRRPVKLNTPSSSAASHPSEVNSQPSPAPRQRIKIPQHDDHEVIESVRRYEERNITPVQRVVNPPKKRREQNDETDSQYVSSVDNPLSNRPSPQRLSPVKLSSPAGRLNSDSSSKRRPIRFDDAPLSPDRTLSSSPQKNQPVQHHKRKSSIDQQSETSHTQEDNIMKVIRDELSERPLQKNEELVIVAK